MCSLLPLGDQEPAVLYQRYDHWRAFVDAILNNFKVTPSLKKLFANLSANVEDNFDVLPNKSSPGKGEEACREASILGGKALLEIMF